MTYFAIRERDINGNRIYGKMNSGDRWWEIQVSSRELNLAFSCINQMLLKDLFPKDGHAEKTVLPVFAIQMRLISLISVITGTPTLFI